VLSNFKRAPDATLRVLLLDCWHHMRLLNAEYGLDKSPPEEGGTTPQHSPLAWWNNQFGDLKSLAAEA
jgi:hypothetical protein